MALSKREKLQAIENLAYSDQVNHSYDSRDHQLRLLEIVFPDVDWLEVAEEWVAKALKDKPEDLHISQTPIGHFEDLVDDEMRRRRRDARRS